MITRHANSRGFQMIQSRQIAKVSGLTRLLSGFRTTPNAHVKNRASIFDLSDEVCPAGELNAVTSTKVGSTTKMWERAATTFTSHYPVGPKNVVSEPELSARARRCRRETPSRHWIRIIAIARGQAGPLPDNPTFRELWVRYRTLKETAWSTATRKSVVSLFEGASRLKKYPSVLSMIGNRRVINLTRDPLQECLNARWRREEVTASAQ